MTRWFNKRPPAKSSVGGTADFYGSYRDTIHTKEQGKPVFLVVFEGPSSTVSTLILTEEEAHRLYRDLGEFINGVDV